MIKRAFLIALAAAPLLMACGVEQKTLDDARTGENEAQNRAAKAEIDAAQLRKNLHNTFATANYVWFWTGIGGLYTPAVDECQQHAFELPSEAAYVEFVAYRDAAAPYWAETAKSGAVHILDVTKDKDEAFVVCAKAN